MAAEISILCGRPVDRVVVVYQKHKNKGWGYIAKQLGIKPGSAKFKALKNKANSCSDRLKYQHKNKNKYKKYKKHK